MAPRLVLHNLFLEMVGHVYFQPPENLKLEYPCIVYQRDSGLAQHGDNVPYRLIKRYQVTVIDRDPESDLPDQVEEMPTCTINRWFAADNLNHWVFLLYF